MNRISRRSAAEQADALLEVGRSEPVLHYDVELGLARHQQWMQSEAPLPEWAAASLGSATRSMVPLAIKTIVSALLVGVFAGGVWLARSRPQQPSAAASPALAHAPEPATSEVDSLMVPRPLPVPEPSSPVEAPAHRASADKRAARSHRPHREPASARPAQRADTSEALAARVAPSENPAAEGVRAEPAARQPAVIEPEPRPSGAVNKPRPEPASEPQGPQDLVEMQQVAAAEQLLARSPERALGLVRQGDERFAHGYFQQERAYIAIMALIRLGRIDEARARAASFARRFPALPYGARIRSALEAAVP